MPEIKSHNAKRTKKDIYDGYTDRKAENGDIKVSHQTSSQRELSGSNDQIDVAFQEQVLDKESV